MMRRFFLFSSLVFMSLPFMAQAEVVIPTDPFYEDQWYLKTIGMEEAWATIQRSSLTPVIVAVIDTGVDIGHEDLQGAIWTNRKEISGNGIDDDQNGYVDDIHGWNFVKKTNGITPINPDNFEAYVHGTLVSSMIAARGNNHEGIAGVDWNAIIMPLVGLDEEGNGLTDIVAKAVDYAVQNGASIINMSIEGDTQDPVLDEALARAKAKGVLTVVAGGNSSMKGGRNLDTSPVYPTCSSLDSAIGLIAVGATDENDRRATFSDFGRCVSISAPGTHITGAEPNSIYSDGWSGTSLAAPLVSGAASILKSIHPYWSPEQIRNQLMKTSEPIDALQDAVYRGTIGSGRLNVARAVAEAQSPSSFEVRATDAGRLTSIWFISTQGTNELHPFGNEDARGARVAIADINADGQPEIAVVPAAGSVAELILYQSDGSEMAHIQLPGTLVDGALVTAVDGGFVVADANGGAAWGVGADQSVRRFFPYGEHYRNGIDLLTIQQQAAFAPRNGGGRLVIADRNGVQLVSAFPFGMETGGRWSLARMDGSDGSFIVFSGPLGSKRIGVETIGQIGWEPVSIDMLSSARITLSSGVRTEDPAIHIYGGWN